MAQSKGSTRNPRVSHAPGSTTVVDFVSAVEAASTGRTDIDTIRQEIQKDILNARRIHAYACNTFLMFLADRPSFYCEVKEGGCQPSSDCTRFDCAKKGKAIKTRLQNRLGGVKNTDAFLTRLEEADDDTLPDRNEVLHTARTLSSEAPTSCTCGTQNDEWKTEDEAHVTEGSNKKKREWQNRQLRRGADHLRITCPSSCEPPRQRCRS